MKENILGVEHPDYLSTKQNIAGVCFKMGQFQKAVSQYNECLTMREKIFGVEHPDYLTTKHNIAGVFQGMGQLQKALELYS